MTDKPVVVDARGLKCPLPRLKAELALRQIDPGTAIKLLCDDPESPVDIPGWCSRSGNILKTQCDNHGCWEFTVEKGS